MSVTGAACITPAPADGDAMHDADVRAASMWISDGMGYEVWIGGLGCWLSCLLLLSVALTSSFLFFFLHLYMLDADDHD